MSGQAQGSVADSLAARLHKHNLQPTMANINLFTVYFSDRVAPILSHWLVLWLLTAWGA